MIYLIVILRRKMAHFGAIWRRFWDVLARNGAVSLRSTKRKSGGPFVCL